MYTEKAREELIEALTKAAGAAFLSLKETTKEHFYFYTFIFDEGLHPYISAWSYEALEKSILEQQLSDEERSWWKWDSADSPYAAYGYDEFFGEASELLDKRAAALPDSDLYGTEWTLRMAAMEEAMKRLDHAGLFGAGKEREQVVINVEQAPPDGDGSEYNRALRLNPPSALLSEYLETCERASAQTSGGPPMEILYAHALLCAAGLAPEEAYTSCLHAQFLARPDDHLLLSLECTPDPYDAARSLQSYFTCHPLDRSRFGQALMAVLRPACAAAADLQHFTDHLYILWNYLPAQISQEQPFWALSYAGEPLSWGDEAQARQLCHTMLRHYDPT